MGKELTELLFNDYEKIKSAIFIGNRSINKISGKPNLTLFEVNSMP